jgi:hypothetical protein
MEKPVDRAPTRTHREFEGHVNTLDRRRFFTWVVAAGTYAIGTGASAQSTLADSDPQAIALGYRAVSTRVDPSKYPQYVAGQKCGLCNFYQGKPGTDTAPCQIFGGKLVASSGWCSAYVKKG